MVNSEEIEKWLNMNMTQINGTAGRPSPKLRIKFKRPASPPPPPPPPRVVWKEDENLVKATFYYIDSPPDMLKLDPFYNPDNDYFQEDVEMDVDPIDDNHPVLIDLWLSTSPNEDLERLVDLSGDIDLYCYENSESIKEI